MLNNLEVNIPEKFYIGLPGDECIVYVGFNGRLRRLHHVVLHSPTGFAWGYGGSGPADLALSILCDYFRQRPGRKQLWRGDYSAARFYQDFKHDMIASLDIGLPFVITETAIHEWLAKQL